MPKKIYNKNAREKALLEEAYASVYSEQLNQEVVVGAEVMWDGQRKRGQVEEVDVENGVAVVYDDDGGEHIVELDNFDVVLNPDTDVISRDVPPAPPAQPGDPHYGLEDEEHDDRTAHATAWAKRQNEKQDLEKMPDLGPHSPGHKRFRNPEEIADWAKKHLGEDDEDEDDDEYDMERDPLGRREADPREW